MDAIRKCLQCGRPVAHGARSCQEGHAWSDPSLPNDLSRQRAKRRKR